MALRKDHVVSSIATGGGGEEFERHVAVAFLAHLLIRGIPPCLHDCYIEEVQFQTGYRRYQTDDVLVVGRSQDGEQRHLLISVKRDFTLGKNPLCVDVMTKAWWDFQNTDTFNAKKDRIALITLRSTKALAIGLGSLLDCARAAYSCDDFQKRLNTPGFIHKQAKAHWCYVKELIREEAGAEVADEDIWKFLQVFYHIALDLTTTSAQTESLIKSMLSVTAQGESGVAAARHTWAELLELVGNGKPRSLRFTYEDLPHDMRERHRAAATLSSSIRDTLISHTTPVLKAIRTHTGLNAHCPRPKLESEIVEGLHKNRFLILTGSAGVGKSALAKSALTQIGADQLSFAFRAGEFSVPHIDLVFHGAQLPNPVMRIREQLALHGRIIFLVESAEGLIEMAEREAFGDFIRLIADEPSWQLLITCRDYHLEHVVDAFFSSLNIAPAIIRIPEWDEEELESLIQQLPSLHSLPRYSAIRTLIKNPFVLGLAAQLDWASGDSTLESIKPFREKVWRELVAKEVEGRGGLPRRRVECFTDIALRRAKDLTPYAVCDTLDPEALEQLKLSGLLISAPTTTELVAISHDVLEDWAVIKWLEERYRKTQGDYERFINEIGSYPALRRAYRAWLSEYLKTDLAAATAFVQYVLDSANLKKHSQDDTLVSVLLSESSADYLATNGERLLHNDAVMLRRLIHLTRVACKTAPAGASEEGTWSSLLIPYYQAWQPVLNFIETYIDTLVKDHHELLIGLLEDWCSGIKSLDEDLPVGAEPVAAIAYSLYARTSEQYYSDHKVQERILKIIVAVPHVDRGQFSRLVMHCVHNRSKQSNQILAEVILGGASPDCVCAHFPEEVMALLRAYWLCSSSDTVEDDYVDPDEPIVYRDREPRGLKSAFNICDGLRYEMFPASAIHGPFWRLLYHHPIRTIRFIVDLLNECAHHYATVPHNYSEADGLYRVALRLDNERVVEQWCSNRLWCLFRGTEVGPDLLASALMALERYCLALCEQGHAPYAKNILSYIIEKSNNVATTAVAASAAMAYPTSLGQIGLIIISCPELFNVDRWRWQHDQYSSNEGFAASTRDDRHIFYAERVQADKREHRKNHLEQLTFELQQGEHCEAVWKILDDSREKIFQKPEQSDDDKWLRHVLTRIDTRHSTLDVISRNDDGFVVLLKPKQIDDDIQELLDRDEPELKNQRLLLAMLSWGRAVYEGGQQDQSNPSLWKEYLFQLQQKIKLNDEGPAYPLGNLLWTILLYITAVCIRDHWDEMSEEDRHWCCDVSISIVENDVYASGSISDGLTHSSKPTPYIIPFILSKKLDRNLYRRVRRAFIMLLSNQSEAVVNETLKGASKYISISHPELFQRSILTIYATSRIQRELRSRRFNRERYQKELKAIVPRRIRKVLEKGIAVAAPEKRLFDLYTEWDQDAVRRLLSVYSHRKGEPRALQFFHLLAKSLVECWKQERRERKYERRDYSLEGQCTRCLVDICLSLEFDKATALLEPLWKEAQHCPREVARFVEEFIVAVDAAENNETFWPIWQLFADSVITATPAWFDQLSRRYDYGHELIKMLCLNLSWKSGVQRWRYLGDNHERIDSLFMALPVSEISLRAYSIYLYTIGSASLPSALELIATQLRNLIPPLLTKHSGASYLEALLVQYIYRYPKALKSQSKLRDEVLYLLDRLVDFGSSAAYIMRDDFATPLPRD